MGRRTTAERMVAAAAVLWTLGAAPGQAAAAGTPTGGYAFDEGAPVVTGAASTADAPRLDPGRTYRSTLPKSGRVYYRLELDATSNTYVSATAVPAPDADIAAVDGLRVSVQDSNSHACSYDSETFGAARSPHPIAAWGAREVNPGKPVCQETGSYYVVVERIATTRSAPQDWGLELAVISEPRTEQDGATSAPEAWDSASPAPLMDEPQDRDGGAGFASATAVGQGAWRTRIAPGQTLFYRVPVDWGQQLNATAELASAGSGSGYAVDALDMSLYSPVRAHVEDVGLNYDGRQKSAALAPLPPVRYANRFEVDGQVNTMRFAGSYYLVVHLAAQVADRFGAGPFGVTLRVRVGGAAQPGPGYAGQAVPRDVFEVTDRDLEAAGVGGGTAAGDDTAMKAVAVGGIGAGSALLLVLGVWTATARRKDAQTRNQMRVNAQNPTA